MVKASKKTTTTKKAARGEAPKHAYHHGNLRAALLDAARRCLDENGPAGLSFREVARKAGVSHAAPYHHFADKQQLLAALAHEAFEGLNASMAEAVSRLDDDATVLQRLVALGRGYVAFAVKEPAGFKLMWQHDDIDFNSPQLQDSANAAYVALSDHVRAVQDATGSQSLPPDLDNVMVWSVVHGLASLQLTGALNIDADQFDGVVHATLERMMGAFLVRADDPRRPHDAVPPPPGGVAPVPDC